MRGPLRLTLWKEEMSEHDRPEEGSIIKCHHGVYRVPHPGFMGGYPRPGDWEYASPVESALLDLEERLSKVEAELKRRSDKGED
jgi:hypothetical protein